jgi:hypothetical protein
MVVYRLSGFVKLLTNEDPTHQQYKGYSVPRIDPDISSSLKMFPIFF